MKSRKRKAGRVSKRLWIVPVILLLVLTLAGGAYYAYSIYQDRQAELQRVQEEEARRLAAEEAAFQAMKAFVNQDKFFEGIFVNDMPIGGMSQTAVRKALDAFEKNARDNFSVKLLLEDQILTLTPEQAGLSFDSDAIFRKAYETGRTSSAKDEREQVLERHSAIEALKTNPLKLQVTAAVDPEKARAAIFEMANSLNYDPIDAQIAGFELASRAFILEEAKPGLLVDAEAIADQLVSRLQTGEFQIEYMVQGKPVEAALYAKDLDSRLGHVSTATTLAGSSSGANRDHNISLIVKKLNGIVLNPGDTFSFNGTIGQRTAAKGFKEAGGIQDGILIQELGGGICQPNTTLYQAVLKADLEIVNRSPHSWPSSYTKIGLDATVSWPGPDFQFRNNTDYPIAIVASFKKPDIVFHIYGRLLEPGVSISLVSEHNGYVKESEPVMKVNYDLAPGETVEIRAPRTGQRATAYKVWYKDGAVIEREVVDKSYYRPIQGIYEYNPNQPTPTPTPEPTPVPTQAPDDPGEVTDPVTDPGNG